MRERNEAAGAGRGPSLAAIARAAAQSERIAELETHIARLRSSGQVIIQQREEWKRRALDAEKRLAGLLAALDEIDLPSAPPPEPEYAAGDRYDRLKRYLARQLHPDNAPGSDIEKLLRAEIFKEIWGEIERLDAN